MKKYLFPVIFVYLILMYSCNSGSSVKVTKSEFVESLWVNGGGMPGIAGNVEVHQYENGNDFFYKDHDVLKLTMNFNFQSIDSEEEPGSEAQRREFYKILVQNSHFYIGDSLIINIWGYWPEKCSNTSAKKMVLFYAIPKNTDLKSLKFEFDKSILGNTAGIYCFNSF